SRKQKQTPKEKNQQYKRGQVERAPTSKGSDRSRHKQKWGKKGKKWITSKTGERKKKKTVGK
ncbi:hypothetical protein IscW_ISCW000114, partial [Ixodes scapularis]